MLEKRARDLEVCDSLWPGLQEQPQGLEVPVLRGLVGRRSAVLRNRTTSSVFLRFFAICSAQARPSSLQRGPRQPPGQKQ